MLKSETQKTSTVQTNEESQDTSRHIDFNNIRFYSQAIKIQGVNH